MTDFFSEFLHVSQIYTLNNEESPDKKDELKKEEIDDPAQVLISQRTRKRKEQDQIQEIVDLYTQKEIKEEEHNEINDPYAGPTFKGLK